MTPTRDRSGFTPFDGRRLSLARRRRGKQRSVLAHDIGVTPSAITQYEKGDSRPSPAVAAKLAMALGYPIEYFVNGHTIEPIDPLKTHFRALRSTPKYRRDQALAYAELVYAVVDAFDNYVDFPTPVVEGEPLDDDGDINTQIDDRAAEARKLLRLPDGPIGNVIQAVEAAGVIVVRLPSEIVDEVSAFSTADGSRPLILLSPKKWDRGRSRFDTAHELGHLLMHPDVEPGSKIVELQANSFAGRFLLPTTELARELPARLDWTRLMEVKKKWGVSLAAILFRGHNDLGLWTDTAYQRAWRELKMAGYPEPGPLGAPETPTLLQQAAAVTWDTTDLNLESFADEHGLLADEVREVIAHGSPTKPPVRPLF